MLTVLNYASFIYPITHQTAPELETDKGDISHTSDYTPYVRSCISGDIQLTGTDYPFPLPG